MVEVITTKSLPVYSSQGLERLHKVLLQQISSHHQILRPQAQKFSRALLSFHQIHELISVALPLVNLQKRASDLPGFRKEKGVTEDQAKIKETRR